MVKVDKTTNQQINSNRIFFFWLCLIISSPGVWAQTALDSIQNAAEWTMSSNGSTIAIVEDNEDTEVTTFRIYRNDGSSWNQLGEDIEIETLDFYFGNQSYNHKQFSLNEDGTVFLVGFAEPDNTDPPDAGIVRTYTYQSENWSQKGQDIQFSDFENSGAIALMSEDGERLSISVIEAEETCIYEYQNGSWDLLGECIELPGDEGRGDYSSLSADFSADGTTLAMGSITTGDSFEAGEVKTYRWNESSWEQIGDRFLGTDSGEGLGSQVALNKDGTILAIGHGNFSNDKPRSGSFTLYEYISDAWSLIGDTISEDRGDWVERISLSDDGKNIAIGYAYEGVVVYQNQDSNWVKTNEIETIEERSSYEISYKGSLLSVQDIGADANPISLFFLGFQLDEFSIPDLTTNAVIDDSLKTVSITVPFGTDISQLALSFNTNATQISPDIGDTLDFTNPVTYTLTAEDTLTTEAWTVAIQEAHSPDFVTKHWANPSINIRTIAGESYNYNVDWGDGSTDENVTSNISHTYDSTGTYTVTISGDFPRLDRTVSLRTIENWGDQVWTSMADAFRHLDTLTIIALDTPNFSQVTDMSRMFNNTDLVGNLNHWDVSNVEDMSRMFLECMTFDYNEISDWDVSSLTDMSYMFYISAPAANHSGYDPYYPNDFDLSNWDVSNVTNMSHAFAEHFYLSELWVYQVPIFRKWNLENWDVSSVTDMSYTFEGSAFEHIENWDVSKVTNMSGMFFQETSSLQLMDIGDWDVSSVTDMSSMFENSSLIVLNLDSWDVGNVERMNNMFAGARNIGRVEEWDVSNVTNMSNMFMGASIDQDLSNWDVDKVTNMSAMFSNATDFNSPLNSWNVSNVTDMSKMFSGAISFNQDLDNWDVSNVENMNSMFESATAFNKPIGNWDVSEVTDMAYMFSGLNYDEYGDEYWFYIPSNFGRDGIFNSSFDQDLNQWDVSNVTDMTYMFHGALSFNGNISNWDVSSVSNTSYMFYAAIAFNQNIQNWDVSNVTDMRAMFSGAASFKQDLNWNVSNVTEMAFMFSSLADIYEESDSEIYDEISSVDGHYTFDRIDYLFFSSTVNSLNAISIYDGDISDWEVQQVTDMSHMLSYSKLSTVNYDAVLEKWSELELQNDVQFGVDDLLYCRNETARQKLIDDFNWTLTGDSQSCPSMNNILGFVLEYETQNASIDLNENTIQARVFYQADITSLSPTITLSPYASVSPSSGTVVDFTNPVTYTVTAGDGVTTKDFVVTVSRSPNEATDFLTFSIPQAISEARINTEEHTINIDVIQGSDLTSLTPSFTLSVGAIANIESGNAIDFSNPVSITVTAEDGVTSQDWTITVAETQSTATDFLTFSFPEQTKNALIDEDEHTIDIEVQNGTDLSSLTPTFTLSEAAIATIESGVTRDFSGPVTYTVIAQNETTSQDWTITVTEAPINATDILAFSLPEQSDVATINTVDHSIEIEVFYGTDVTTLTPEFTLHQGATSDIASGSIVDFSEPVIFTVTAKDGVTTQEWTVEVTLARNSATDFLTFSFSEQSGEAIIDMEEHIISIEVGTRTDLTSLIPSFTLSDGAISDKGNGSSMDFSEPVTFNITAEDRIASQAWIITVTNLVLSNEEVMTEPLVLYPNPTTDYINLKLATSYRGKVNYRVVNLNGKSILANTVIQKSDRILDHQINLTGLQKGMYVFIVEVGNEIQHIPFVKQ